MANGLDIISQTAASLASQEKSLRVAFVGKGGAGKSVLAGTLARVLARRGHRVLALDVDTLPGLALSLGLSLEAVGDAGMPEELGERQAGRGWVLREGVDVASLVAEHAAVAPDGIRFLQLGKLPGRVKPGSTTAFRAVLEEFREAGWTMVGDLAAGTRQPFFGWSDFAQVVLVVVEPSAKAMLGARRLAKLAHGIADHQRDAGERPLRPIIRSVANKVRTVNDLQRMEQALTEQASPLLAVVPYDEQLATAERLGHAPFDIVPAAPAVAAVQELAVRLEQLVSEG
jgi:CO dehydrogenase maturation factor